MNHKATPLRFSVQHDLAPKKGFSLDFSWEAPLAGGTSKVGIFGPSGSGKTSLLQSIAGLIPQAYYQLTYDDSHYSRYGRRDHPAVYVGGNTPLFEHLTVLDNLRLTQRKSGFARRSSIDIEQVIAWCDIADLLHQFPGSLSGGETQRAVFARAIVSAKPLLLLDEAFSALDVKRRIHMLELVNYLCEQQGLSCLMVSHALSDLAISCNELLLVDAGRIAKSGDIRKLLSELQREPGSSETGWSVLQVFDPEVDDKNDLIRWQVQPMQSESDEEPRFVYQKRQARHPFDGHQNTQRLIVEASAVSLSLRPLSDTSFVNQLPATIVGLQQQDNGWLVEANTRGQRLRAFISTASYHSLLPEPNQPVWLIFKALA